MQVSQLQESKIHNSGALFLELISEGHYYLKQGNYESKTDFYRALSHLHQHEKSFGNAKELTKAKTSWWKSLPFPPFLYKYDALVLYTTFLNLQHVRLTEEFYLRTCYKRTLLVFSYFQISFMYRRKRLVFGQSSSWNVLGFRIYCVLVL